MRKRRCAGAEDAVLEHRDGRRGLPGDVLEVLEGGVEAALTDRQMPSARGRKAESVATGETGYGAETPLPLCGAAMDPPPMTTLPHLRGE